MQLPQNNDQGYLHCHGLSSEPFRLSPDPEFFFPSRPHIEAREVLQYAIRNDEGFMVLTGPAGTGKTLLLRLLLQEMAEDKVAVVVTNPVLTPDGLLHQILLELGHELDAAIGEPNLLADFQKVLLQLAAEGRDILVIIDEAQNIPPETLEYLRMLSNIETNRKKLLQILLTGQPELVTLLENPRLAQLSQRISVYEQLRPLTVKETMEYVNYRLAKAGRGDLRLTMSGRKTLFRLTGGVPRLINRLMNRALLIACGDCRGKLTAAHIRKAAQTLPPSPHRQSGSMITVPGVVVMLLLIGFLLFLFSYPTN